MSTSRQPTKRSQRIQEKQLAQPQAGTEEQNEGNRIPTNTNTSADGRRVPSRSRVVGDVAANTTTTIVKKKTQGQQQSSTKKFRAVSKQPWDAYDRKRLYDSWKSVDAEYRVMSLGKRLQNNVGHLLKMLCGQC